MNQTKVQSKWKVAPEIDPSFHQRLNRQLKGLGKRSIHPLVARHLQSMGMTSVREAIQFLFPKKDHCHSPWKLKGMRETVEQLENAIVGGLPITVVGDYDVDGVMATAIAYQALQELGAVVDTYLPHRTKEGYGIKPLIVENLKKRGTKVILTVDNGIAAHEAASLAKHYGMTVLITDHHTPGENLPVADSIINPHQVGCSYPFKQICGGAIAYKLAQALFEYMGMDDELVHQFDEMLAICTVADVMPLRDENRYFVLNGLKKMKKKPSRPVKDLLKALGMTTQQLDETAIGFYIGPALNAPGRLDSAEDSLKLFLSKTPHESIMMANMCVEMNKRRKELVEKTMKIAETLITPTPVQVLKMDVHEGIAGIIAGQVKESTGCPTFVLTPAHTESGQIILKGSARSHEGFSLYRCLKDISDNHPEWFLGWGGHAAAAGLSIRPEYVEEFAKSVNDLYHSVEIEESAPYYLDTISEDAMEDLSFELARLAPFGMGHLRPVFKVDCHIVEKKIFGPKQNHLRLLSAGGKEYTLFRGAELPITTNQKASIYVSIGRSVFAGREKMDVFIEDIEQ
ncbi:single-stranded-DNA-specific exonuclease RecJ [Neobacillus sp. YIM B02564]|uniref:Single-stranded-DNA-specific exonuclease RecJ n=1 Tax=Neobacillus paridis TaxID=2803862 RepID=A0ABS1TQK6_9BACI|nr:single-stranded-DNA-specific exonuclease RecJ [Neobacillus paridis]MBL4952185.1 single-stranded-DNA-specific exonuclease RecJ [Neobacillus paridis]